MISSKMTGWTKLILDTGIPVAFISWAIASYWLPSILTIPAVILFTAALFTRSYLRYTMLSQESPVSRSFGVYVTSRRVIPQNVISGVIMGISGLILRLIHIIASTIGGTLLLILFDMVLVALITVSYLIRPGKKRTIERSMETEGYYSNLIISLSERYGIRNVQLRILPFTPGSRPNAFSWGLPLGRNYIFATNSLFTLLDRDQAGGILTHEIGHLKFHHSSKSFLYSAVTGILWFNGICMPFILSSLIEGLLVLSFSMFMGVMYFVFFRSAISRHFENSADIFAGRNWDRDAYVSALRTLTSVGADGRAENGRAIKTHRTLEEREKLIRGL